MELNFEEEVLMPLPPLSDKMYCILCGKEIEYKVRITFYRQLWRTKVDVPVCEEHRLKCKGILETDPAFTHVNGFCFVCGKELVLTYNKRWGINRFKHVKCRINQYVHKKLEVIKYKTAHPHPLKPWQDPESLFCDTEFLEKFLGKKPKKGKECKDNHRE